MNQLHICTFKGLQNLPLYIARQQGYFASRGLDVVITYTAGSLPQLAGLAGGAYQLIQTAPDNVINIDNNPAAFGLDPSAAPHVIMVLGGSVGPLSVYAQPAITTLDHLRGTVLGVDNPTSGFALVLQDLLARSGLLLERDYTLTVSGGTSSRLDALKSGSVAATILYAPFDVQATQAGFTRLATSTDYHPAYASLATAGLQSWIEQHTAEVTSYISAYLQALRWIYNPNHATEVQRVIESEPTLNLDTSIAPGAYAAFVDPQTGFGINAKLDDAGLQQVIELRATYGSFSRLDRDLAHYRDLRWYPS
jgi:ABC-type nitrate/sulfonate/bicarbonate transport system substrate-binding protein